METLFKRYFWAVNLTALAMLAFLSARLVNNVVAGKLAAMTTTPNAKATDTPVVVTRGVGPARDVTGWSKTIQRRNIFNSEPPGPPPPDEDADGGEVEELPDGVIPGPLDDCEKSEAKVSLVATMVAEPSEWSLAILKGSSRDSRLVKEGETIEDREVAAIYRERMVLAYGAKYECVDLGNQVAGGKKKGFDRSRASTSRSNNNKIDSAAIKDGVKKTGTNNYEIDREMLNEQLEDLNKLARQARVIPHYKNGKPEGFKLVGVRPGSLYSHIGIRSGDVIKGINDEEISSPNKALELYEKLRTTDEINVTVERRGRKIDLGYIIK